jgi:hypothetical protein
MAKVYEMAPNLLAFHCPGCNYEHLVGVRGRKIPGSNGSMNEWDWNGSFDAPTFMPSLLINAAGFPPSPRCHSFVRDGKIQFLADSTHLLGGKTVDLPEWE